MCGGTPYFYILESSVYGLSPRVRGNRAGAGREQPDKRSIPACAGEPTTWDYRGNIRKVYPRVCGGTQSVAIPPAFRYGLSPRVRGNRASSRLCSTGVRSIPACAGEPGRIWSMEETIQVYPRVCGGTQPGQEGPFVVQGLSPRVRGNRASFVCERCETRSIPACAGEPRGLYQLRRPGKVYPRVCGGTDLSAAAAAWRAGLSPRVRGNLHRRNRREVVGWSIPACAGEPRRAVSRPSRAWVYPRVCGGT